MKLGTFSVMFLLFLVLKLTGVITWSWWWVTSPLWISACIVFFLVIILILLEVKE